MTHAFERQAFREGFITAKSTPPGFLPEQPSAIESANLEQALCSLVIFGKLYLDSLACIGNTMCLQADPPNEDCCLNYTRLWQEGLIAFGEHGRIRREPQTETALLGQESILLDYEGLSAYAPLIKDFILVNGTHREVVAFEKLLPTLLGMTRALASDDLSDEYVFTSVMAELTTRHPDLYYVLDGHVYDFFRLIRTSEKNGCPIRSNCRQVNSPREDRFAHSESAFRLYQVVLEEHCTFPYPRTVASALKLSRDKRVMSFRHQLFRWSEDVLKGASDEPKVRLEIRKTKKDLERLDTYKTAGRILTFLSLPLTIAGLLTGLPLGLSLLPVGPLMTIDAMRRERQHAWLMFGKT